MKYTGLPLASLESGEVRSYALRRIDSSRWVNGENLTVTEGTCTEHHSTSARASKPTCLAARESWRCDLSVTSHPKVGSLATSATPHQCKSETTYT